VKRRTGMICVALLALTIVGYAPAVSAARDTASPREARPAAVGQDRPWSAGHAQAAGAALTRLAPKNIPPAGVDAKTYQREKAAAVRGPAAIAAQVAIPRRPLPRRASMPLIFNGLDRPGAMNNGFVFNPPDTIAGKSPNRVLEGANSALRLFSNSGSVIATQNLNTFFGAATANGRLFDPKVYFDRNATNQRFYVVALQVAGRDDTNTANDVSRIWVAVSRSPDPANLSSANWCRYNIDARRNVGTTNVSWADYPAIGAGRDTFSFAMNQFRFTNRSFTFAVIHVWNKTIASNNAASCPSVPRFTFQPSPTAGDFSRFTIQPAQHYTSPSSFTGTTNPAYYLSTRRGSSNEYHAYRVRNVASGSPTLAQLVLTSTSYGIPPSSPQPSSSILVDTGDNRMLQVAGIGNDVAGIFNTVCNFTAGTPNESCTLAPRVVVGQNSGGSFTASIAENTFAGFGDNVFVHHSSIARNSALQAASTWEFGGPTTRLSSASMIKNVNGAWAGVLTYAPGTCSLPATAPSTTTARSGDYSGAQTDPSNLSSFWLAGEQAVTISGTCQWRTRIGSLVP
jgi:hypothetical protein